MTKKTGFSRRKFLLGTGVAAAGATAYGAYHFLYKPPAIYRGPVSSLEDLKVADPFDVCIIGSGPAGTVLGIDLARKGIRTLIIESGVNLVDSMSEPRYQELNGSENAGGIDYPLASSRIRALGGTSNIWTGRCSRLHPLDFERNAYTPADAAWPVTYDEIEPYYSKAEYTLRVRGDELSDYHARRSGPLPLPADLDINGLKEMMAGVGVTVDDSPSSTGASGRGPVRVANELLPQFAKFPSASVVSGLTVTRLLSDDGGNISSVEVKNLDRQALEVKARHFVVACGGVGSAHLMLLSQDERNASGIGNQHDQVGRWFTEHPNVLFTGKVEHTLTTMSPQFEIGRCHQFYDEFKHRGLGSVLLVLSQSWLFRNDLKGWDLDAIRQKAKDLMGRLAAAEVRIGATMEMLPQSSNRIALSASEKDYFGNAVPEVNLSYSSQDNKTLLETQALIGGLYERLKATEVEQSGTSWSHHHSGTCRMGNDPATSVTDRNLKVHSAGNLYVAGSANYVTAGAAHPTLLITALSHRLGDHLIEKMTAG